MADLLIRDVAMPKDRNTTLIIYCDGTINLRVQMEDGEHLIPITAKAVPLPEGHGKLIDADALQKSVLSQCEMVDAFGVPEMSQIAELIKNGLTQEVGKAETIIEAEGGGEDG